MSDGESQVSWPDSDHDAPSLPLTPHADRTHDVLAKQRKQTESDRVVDPVTPKHQRVQLKQLDTPPDTLRKRRYEDRGGEIQDSPSKRATLDRSANLVSELETNAQIGSLGTKVRLHIAKQDRLLEASLRSRDVLRNLIKQKDAEIDVLRNEVKLYKNERETQRAMTAALRREVAHLETFKKQ